MSGSTVFDEKYKSLNRKQKEAVDAIYGPVMVIAGPGTGKTTVLTLRIANILLKTDAKPDEILALTFTESGARAMREKLRELIGDTSFRVGIFTFHGFANYIRGLYPENFEKIGERMPASDADKIAIIEEILSKKSFKELRVSEYGVSIGKISGRISDLKRELVSADDLKAILRKEKKEIESWREGLEKVNKTTEKEIERREKGQRRLEEFAELYEEYEKELEKKAYYDFDDAILELIRALKDNPDMLAEVRESFQFVLADEHQDANGAQNEILKLFKGEDADPPNIFVVGDDKQSIFRFQGASLEHFYNFSDEFPGAKKIALEDNYRSQRLILDASHSLIGRDGRVHQKLTANVIHPEKKIEITEYLKHETELAHVAKRVKEIVASAPNGTVAVITRHNQTLFELGAYLRAEEVAFSIAGERSLFDDFEYQKLRSLLEALCNPFDGRLLQALYKGFFGATITDILLIAGGAKSSRKDFATVFLEGGFTDLDLSDEVGLKETARAVKKLIAQAKKTPVLDFLKEIRAEIYANAKPEAFAALRSVFDEAGKLTLRNRTATLDDLVSHLKFLEKHNLAPLSSEKHGQSQVELLSVHRSKGLEYDHVFIIDTTEKKFGGQKRGDLLSIPGVGIDTELAEERRLLYVAITRARRHVALSYALEGLEGGDNAPAALLEEIDPELVDRKVFDGEIAKVDLLSVAKRGKSETVKALQDAFLHRSFSVTALNNFIECPWKYVWRNLLLVPDVPEFHLNLGNACHNVLKEFHLMAKKGETTDLKSLVSRCVHKEPFTANELPLALEKAEEYITVYCKSFAPFDPDAKVFVEEPLSFVYTAKDGERSFDVTITGKIDLAIEKDSDVSVIDFKTKKRMTRNAIMGNTKTDNGNEMRQLQFYKFLIENTKSDLSVSKGILTFLVPEGGKILSEEFELLDKDKEGIEETLRNALFSIHSFNFFDKTCGERDCEYCKYKEQLVGE
ncbi:MAG: ATP-dependent DNA helicase [Candidatus Paceibacterota bacterium]|jgi:DNA helicase-2/ATP-dependent DNA helicase PcrA